MSTNIYPSFVFPDKLVSPVNGYICKRITTQTIKPFGFSSKEELLATYPDFPLMCESAAYQIKSAANTARELQIQRIKDKNNDLLKEYNLNPKICLHCTKQIDFEKRNNKFCCGTCRASYTNLRRIRNPWSQSQRNAFSQQSKILAKTKPPSLTRTFKVCFSKCNVCDKGICHRGSTPQRKTCSRECKILASTGMKTYQNGRKKLFRYFNNYQNKEVILESSFELTIAEFLDLYEIMWVRPKPIKWYDHTTMKTRFYYPDFYLPAYDVYLDPKNPYVIKLDAIKLSVVSNMIHLIYGDVKSMQEKIIKML